MSSTSIHENEQMENQLVDRLTHSLNRRANIHFVIIGILFGALFASGFYSMSMINDGIIENRFNIQQLNEKITKSFTDLKVEIAISNTYLQILANDVKNDELNKKNDDEK